MIKNRKKTNFSQGLCTNEHIKTQNLEKILTVFSEVRGVLRTRNIEIKFFYPKPTQT